MDEKKTLTTTAVTTFAALVATAYLISYWNSFGIDVFQYAGFVDVVKLAVAPLFYTIVSGFGAFYIGSLMMTGSLRERVENPPDFLTLRILSALAVIGALFAWRYTFGETRIGILMFLAMPVGLQLSNMEILRQHLPRYYVRCFGLLFILWAPMLASGVGVKQAARMQSGWTRFVVDNVGLAANTRASREHPLVLIGHLGNKYIVYETQTGSTVLLNEAENLPLIIKPNPLYQ